MTSPDDTELPPSWAWARLDHICEINPRKWNTPLDTDEMVSFIPMAALEAESGRIGNPQTKTWGEVRNKTYTKFQDGDILFAKVTPCMENGKIAVAENLKRGRGVGSTEFHVLRPSNTINCRYLFHYLLQRSFRSMAERSMSGAVGLRRVPANFLKEHKIPLPPLTEQHRIVEALEGHLSRLDTAERLLLTANKRSMIFARRLIDYRLKDSPIVPLSALLRTSLINGRSVPSEDGGFPVLRLTALKNETLDLSECKAGQWSINDAKPFLVSKDDFFVSRGNGSRSLVGRGALLTHTPVDPIAFPDTMIRIQVNQGKVLPKFLQIAWGHPVVRRHIEGNARTTAGIYKINQRILEQTPVPLPPIEEQHKILSYLDSALAPLEAAQRSISRAHTQASHLRASLLKCAFTGRLIGHNSADEPARGFLDSTHPPKKTNDEEDKCADVAHPEATISTSNKSVSIPILKGIQEELPL